MSVYVTTYEIVGAGLESAADHFEKIRRSRIACFAVAEKMGAVGYRPGSYGTAIRALFFAGDKPKGWIAVGREGENIEARPNLNTKAGKAAAADMNPPGLAPPDDEALAGQFGWSPTQWPTDGRSFYFATAMHLQLPADRYFLRLPRQEGDDYTPPATLSAIPESEFMLAIETHNRLAREANESARACAA